MHELTVRVSILECADRSLGAENGVSASVNVQVGVRFGTSSVARGLGLSGKSTGISTRILPTWLD